MSPFTSPLYQLVVIRLHVYKKPFSVEFRVFNIPNQLLVLCVQWLEDSRQLIAKKVSIYKTHTILLPLVAYEK